MKLTLTVAQRELINEYANRNARHSNTRVMVMGDLDGVEKWFADGDQTFDVDIDTMVRVQNMNAEENKDWHLDDDDTDVLPPQEVADAEANEHDEEEMDAIERGEMMDYRRERQHNEDYYGYDGCP